MQISATRIFGTVVVLCAISCAAHHQKNIVSFARTDEPAKYYVDVEGRPIGIHANLRGAGKMCGHLNTSRTWLVVEDGCGGDSYPKVTAYKIQDGSLMKSQDLERIDKEHYLEYSQGRGTTDPVFHGFNASGYPLIISATGTHTLHE
jgi:hypothetical protein